MRPVSPDFTPILRHGSVAVLAEHPRPPSISTRYSFRPHAPIGGAGAEAPITWTTAGQGRPRDTDRDSQRDLGCDEGRGR